MRKDGERDVFGIYHPTNDIDEINRELDDSGSRFWQENSYGTDPSYEDVGSEVFEYLEEL